MKLSYVELCGFRGYRQIARIDFSAAFTIIDGRNGVGKSTIFDAIEFGLTGNLSKYRGAKAAGETVADYLWWSGTGAQPKDRYVEIGFADEDSQIVVRRSQFDDPRPSLLAQLSAKLSDPQLAPSSPLDQLCSSSIIRDEHIAELSLDLNESDRYALLRGALGANEAELWISRASQVLALAKRRTGTIQQEVAALNSELASAARRLDEVRSNLVGQDVLAASVERLRTFVGNSQASPENLDGPTRARLAGIAGQLELVDSLLARWSEVAHYRENIPTLEMNVNRAQAAAVVAEQAVGQTIVLSSLMSASSLAARARELVALIANGQRLGLQNDACPLCATKQSHDQFEHGIQAMRAFAARLDADAARQAELETAQQAAVDRLEKARANVDATRKILTTAIQSTERLERDLTLLHLGVGTRREDLLKWADERRFSLESAQHDLRVLATIRFSGEFERSRRAEAEMRTRLARAQERFSRARKAEAAAQALYDASRRAAAENLDRRLDRVLPLMSELYKRLRPHPIWQDIEYSIRGDVRRFLKLQVGEDLNPQFLFSSGQRRATGLAFLLSINLSLAWSSWNSILLDDPVQHVDDFRAVHLAEVLAQLIERDRQIICAVEDAALADLLCRRLPVAAIGSAKRVTLGPSVDGDLAKLAERELAPLLQRAVIVASQPLASGASS